MSAKSISAITIIFLLLVAAYAAQDLQTQGKALVSDLLARQFDKVTAQFDERMKGALPSSKLADLLDTILAQYGPYRSITGTHTGELQAYQLVFVTCQFDQTSVDFRLVYDSNAHVAGFFYAPSQPTVEWKAPDYAKQSTFTEKGITIKAGPYELPGTLTLPQGAALCPAVVLVHGSGPNDQDESIGPNKPFKDLAWGLASRGIAVLRYTKRTLMMAQMKEPLPAAFTVKEETVEDARTAVSLLAKTNGIDPKRIYVLGHSLGGMLAPRIAAGDKEVSGIILMAGSTQPLEQSVVEQLKYLAALPGKNGEESAKLLPAAEEAAKQIQSPTLAPAASINLLGARIPGSYFLDLRNYHPGETAAGLKTPMLVLQGDRDYQVTMKDFEGWKTALDGHAGVTFKIYSGLTHLFMPSVAPGTGPGTPDDYTKPGHVVEAVISDIASWIQAR
jgi:dienelactone hydrolase